MSQGDAITLRPLHAADLHRANAVVEAAVSTWHLPDRVKRLSLQSYRYQPHDLDHLSLVAAEDAAGRIVGVAAWEPASAGDAPTGRKGLLLHGLYVDPARQRQGIGRRLLGAAEQAARQGGFEGLLVKANRDAQGYFLKRGLQPLPVDDPRRDYPYRFWLKLGSA